MVRHVERQARRMHDMMHRLDVDPAALARERGGDAYAEARTRCLKCLDAHECVYWLEAGVAADAAPDFCPNRELFESFRR
jgi:hypothetical protein